MTQEHKTMQTDTRAFRLQDAQGHDVLGGEVGIANPYIGGGYGALVAGRTPVQDLAVDECTQKVYALSGQRPTTYTIVRVR